MKIGVDIDGVLTERTHFLWAVGAKFCVEKGLKCRINPGVGRMGKMFDMGDNEVRELWHKYGWGWTLDDAAIRPFAAEVIRGLRDEGHEIWYYIYSRIHELLDGKAGEVGVGDVREDRGGV